MDATATSKVFAGAKTPRVLWAKYCYLEGVALDCNWIFDLGAFATKLAFNRSFSSSTLSTHTILRLLLCRSKIPWNQKTTPLHSATAASGCWLLCFCSCRLQQPRLHPLLASLQHHNPTPRVGTGDLQSTISILFFCLLQTPCRIGR